METELAPDAALAESCAQIVDELFATMLGMQARPIAEPHSLSEEMITSAIYFTGSFSGALVFECVRTQAWSFATAFMGLQREELSEADVLDTIGEIANIIGGNLKHCLPHGSSITTPSVIVGRSYRLTVGGATVVARLAFTAEDDPFFVTILRTENGAPSL